VDFACLRPARRGFAQAGISDCGFRTPKSEIHNKKLQCSLLKQKKAMEYSSIAFSKIDLPVRRQKQKRPWELEAAHGLRFNSNNYSSTGQASIMFAQHHQLPCVTLKTFSTAVLF
jgi:hypothetical protein